MRRLISHSAYTTLFGVVYLGLGANVLLALACLPLLVLLITTDPSLSWPLLALAAAPCGPAIAAVFSVFRAHGAGETAVVRPFLGALRATWRRSLALSALVVAVVVVAAVDVFVLVPTGVGAVAAPLLIVIAVLALAAGMVGLVAIAEAPDARLRDVLRVALLLSVRRWPLTLVSLAVAGAQAAVFAAAPAIAIGVTAAACLYVVWAGGRHTLQPALTAAAERAAA